MLQRFAVQCRKNLQILRDDPAEIASREPALDQPPGELPLPVECQIVESGARGEGRRLPEAVPVHILAGLHVPVQLRVVVFAGFPGKKLPLHAQKPDFCFVHKPASR